MFRVILSIVLLVILVILIVLNLGFTTSFNLFGWKFEEIPVTAVALVAFAVGVLYSFAYYLGRFFSKISKTKFRKRGEQVKVREQELQQKEKQLDIKADVAVVGEPVPKTNAGPVEGGFTPRQTEKRKSSRKKREK